MKHRRMITFALLGTIMGGTFLSSIPVANATNSVDKVKVDIDGQSVSEGGVILDGRTYLSIRQVEDVLRAFVKWDPETKRITINKPNVNLLLFQDKTPFGKVKTGKTTFSVLTQVDNLSTNVNAIKLTITNPNNKTSEIQESKLKTNEDNFWFRSSDFKYDFKSKGDYTIKCYLKPVNGDYTLVSEMKVEAI